MENVNVRDFINGTTLVTIKKTENDMDLYKFLGNVFTLIELRLALFNFIKECKVADFQNYDFEKFNDLDFHIFMQILDKSYSADYFWHSIESSKNLDIVYIGYDKSKDRFFYLTNEILELSSDIDYKKLDIENFDLKECAEKIEFNKNFIDTSIAKIFGNKELEWLDELIQNDYYKIRIFDNGKFGAFDTMNNEYRNFEYYDNKKDLLNDIVHYILSTFLDSEDWADLVKNQELKWACEKFSYLIFVGAEFCNWKQSIQQYKSNFADIILNVWTEYM